MQHDMLLPSSDFYTLTMVLLGAAVLALAPLYASDIEHQEPMSAAAPHTVPRLHRASHRFKLPIRQSAPAGSLPLPLRAIDAIGQRPHKATVLML